MKIIYQDGSTQEVDHAAESAFMQITLHPTMNDQQKKEAFLNYFPGEDKYYDKLLKENSATIDMLNNMMKAFIPK